MKTFGSLVRNYPVSRGPRRNLAARNKALTFFCLLLLLSTPFIVNAQTDWRLQLNDKWYNVFASKALKVGDLMPDISLGKVINNATGKSRFRQFKGKLLILDFWSTNCSSCIAAFPRMEALQKEFGDKIQIIAVNNSQTEEYINKDGLKMYGNNFRLPALPCIMAEEQPHDGTKESLMKLPLYSLFPYRGLPYHVWIGPDGRVVQQGTALSTTAEKIQAFLADRKVFTAFSNANLPSDRDSKFTYHQLLGNFRQTPVNMGSVITSYNNEINGIYQSYFKLNQVDSNMGTVRNYFFNSDLVTLYTKDIFDNIVGKQQSNVIYTHNIGRSFCLFPPNKDTSTFFSDYQTTDRLVMANQYCYEQLAPMSISNTTLAVQRIEDLNRYFGNHLGITGQISNISIPCYLLVKIGPTNNLKVNNTKHKEAGIDAKYIKNIRGVNMYEWKGISLPLALGMLLSHSSELSLLFDQTQESGKPWILLDETGFEKSARFDIALPHQDNLRSIEDLRKALQPYGLDIIEAQREFKFIVFSNVNK